MENILIIDTETSSLTPETGDLLEVAGIFYNMKSRSIINQVSFLNHAGSNLAEPINRISLAALESVNREINISMRKVFLSLLTHADAVISHNNDFDKPWLAKDPILATASNNKHWICTLRDVKWPIRKGASLALTSICMELGVPIINVHRALSDCLLILEAFNMIDDLENFLLNSGKGRYRYNAQVSFDQRQSAKDEGFVWDTAQRVWHAFLTPEEASYMPFTVIQVGKKDD